MKKILSVFTAIVGFVVPITKADVLSTNVTSGGMHLLTTSRANVANVTISSDKVVTIYLYDADSLDAPYYGTNYVTAAYPTRTSYATNYVTSFVGQNGVTNWYTNAGLWTITTTNAAATNALPSQAFTIGANTAVAFDVNLLFINGITMRATTNATIVLNYNSGR